MKKLLLILVSVCFLNAANIRVAAAANIGYVLEDLKAEFLKTNPNDTLEVVLASSGKLNAQIKNGADYAVFMAANMDFAQDVFKNGLATAPAEAYTRGVLVMFSKDKRDMTKGLELLKDKDIHKIAVANTKTAPYGIASLEAFKKAGVYESIKDKIVQADSISGVLPYALSAAEIGFIPKSALSGKDEYKKGENFIEVDRAIYTPLDQGMVLIKTHEKDKLANDFYKFIKSDVAKAIFAKHGYE